MVKGCSPVEERDFVEARTLLNEPVILEVFSR